MARFKLKGWQPIFQAQALQACRQKLKGGIKMKKSLMALLMGIALMASNTLTARAEPITLTVVAISGITAVALSAAADKAIHRDDAKPADQKNDDRGASQAQAPEVKPIQQAEKPAPSTTAVK
jgi:hypothetical protein